MALALAGVKEKSPPLNFSGGLFMSASSSNYCPSTIAKISGATMVASDSMMYFGVS
jgi:hypothetical protein